MTAIIKLGISPSHWMGGPARFDDADRTLVTAWLKYEASLCGLCGRPLSAHETETPDDYATGFFECPATEALDKAQAEKHVQDKPAIDKGLSPDRSRQWITWHTTKEDPPGGK